MKMKQSMKRAIVIGIAGAIAFGEAAPSFAAPVPSSTVAVKTTAPDMVDQVRSRRSRAVGAGVALGVIGAMVGAAAAQNQYYYGGPGYYAPGYYGGPVYYGPGYYGGDDYGYGYRYDPGPAIALGIVGAAAGAMTATPYRRARPRGGACWILTDRDRNFGYWGQCR